MLVSHSAAESESTSCRYRLAIAKGAAGAENIDARCRIPAVCDARFAEGDAHGKPTVMRDRYCVSGRDSADADAARSARSARNVAAAATGSDPRSCVNKSTVEPFQKNATVLIATRHWRQSCSVCQADVRLDIIPLITLSEDVERGIAIRVLCVTQHVVLLIIPMVGTSVRSEPINLGDAGSRALSQASSGGVQGRPGTPLILRRCDVLVLPPDTACRAYRWPGAPGRLRTSRRSSRDQARLAARQLMRTLSDGPAS
jgi:hypothetical protein